MTRGSGARSAGSAAHAAASAHDPRMEAICDGPGGDPEVFRSILARVGDKWSMMLIGMLQEGPRRFTELKSMTPGISSRMLTQTLRQLERDGLVSREIFAEIPPRVEYRVTPLGRSLIPAVLALAEWAAAHTAEIARNREDYDVARDGASARDQASAPEQAAAPD